MKNIFHVKYGCANIVIFLVSLVLYIVIVNFMSIYKDPSAISHHFKTT